MSLIQFFKIKKISSFFKFGSGNLAKLENSSTSNPISFTCLRIVSIHSLTLKQYFLVICFSLMYEGKEVFLFHRLFF